MGSKTLHQQNPPVLNWSCRLTQVELYNGREMEVVRLLLLYLHFYIYLLNDFSQTNYLNIYWTDLHHIFSIARTVAVD